MKGERRRPILRLAINALLLAVVSFGTREALAAPDRPLAAAARPVVTESTIHPGAPRTATAETTAHPAPPIATVLTPTALDQLESDLNSIAAQSGGRVGISLQELSGPRRVSISLGGNQSFYAASAYKLPLLMAEGQQIASGQARPSDVLCYDPSDYEDGWFTDYNPGSCFTRQELSERAGIYSDNTAAHILVRYLGGGDALNAYARAAGMTASALWIPNNTTPDDLANALVNEALGRLGGSSAQQWLYPLLTHTADEQGIPAGLPANVTAVHKVGDFGGMENDTALVSNGQLTYVVSVAIDGTDEATGWTTIARISARIWQYETRRPQFVTPPAATPAPILWPDQHPR